MFFILNNEKMVIAADNGFLKHAGVDSIYVLAERFREGVYLLDEENSTCLINGDKTSYTRSALHTLFGSGHIYELEESPSAEIIDNVPEKDKKEAQDEEAESHLLKPEIAIPAAGAIAAAATAVSNSDEELLDILNLEEDDTKGTEEDISREIDEALSLIESSHEDDPIKIPEPETKQDDIDDFLLDLEENTEESQAKEKADTDQEQEIIDDLLDIKHDSSDNDDVELDTNKHNLALADEDQELLNLLDLDDELDDIKISDDPQEDTEELEGLIEIAKPEMETEAETEAKSSDDDIKKPDEEDDELFDLLDLDLEPEIAKSSPEVENIISDDISIKEEMLEIGTEAESNASKEANIPFGDYHANAKLIGISSKEYLSFLEQFTEEAAGFEEGLKSSDYHVFKKNITSIKDAAQLLHLPQLAEGLEKMDNASSDERDTLLHDFFGKIQHIQRDLKGSEHLAHTVLHNESTTPTTIDSTENISQPDLGSKSTVDIGDIEPIPFDFSAKLASDELGLPESLVSEFVSDFVGQAKENISIFNEAQEKGDIETIQKTAHLLKGAASNLRIDPLADTLQELQYNEDGSKVPDLIKKFLGQLKSLENFTMALS